MHEPSDEAAWCACARGAPEQLHSSGRLPIQPDRKGLDREKGPRLIYLRDGIQKPILLSCPSLGRNSTAILLPTSKLTLGRTGARRAAGVWTKPSCRPRRAGGRTRAGA